LQKRIKVCLNKIATAKNNKKYREFVKCVLEGIGGEENSSFREWVANLTCCSAIFAGDGGFLDPCFCGMVIDPKDPRGMKKIKGPCLDPSSEDPDDHTWDDFNNFNICTREKQCVQCCEFRACVFAHAELFDGNLRTAEEITSFSGYST
jgi:hypothetical protein